MDGHRATSQYNNGHEWERERERDDGHLGQDLASKMKKVSDRPKVIEPKVLELLIFGCAEGLFRMPRKISEKWKEEGEKVKEWERLEKMYIFKK